MAGTFGAVRVIVCVGSLLTLAAFARLMHSEISEDEVLEGPLIAVDVIVAAAVPASSTNRGQIADVLERADPGQLRMIGPLFPPLSRHVRASLRQIAEMKGSDHHCVIVDWSPVGVTLPLGLAFGHDSCLILALKDRSTAVAARQTHASDLRQAPNHQICQTSFTFQNVASLLLTGTIVDYQLILGTDRDGWLQFNTTAELEITVCSFVQLAIHTVIEVPKSWHLMLQQWGPLPATALTSLLKRNGVDVTTSEIAPGIFLLYNSDVRSWGRPPPRLICERVWQLCGCETRLEPSACTHERVRRRVAHTTPARVHFNLERVAQTTAPRLASIPAVACKNFASAANSVWADTDKCTRGRLSGSVVYENDGWHRCRNKTHWLSGCVQYVPRAG